MASKQFKIEFPAEFIQVTAKKMASLDVGVRLVLDTQDLQPLTLAALDTGTLLKVTLEKQP